MRSSRPADFAVDQKRIRRFCEKSWRITSLMLSFKSKGVIFFMNRICGECTACCKTHGVREIKKMSGTWCSHCSIGKGCEIYSERPAECRCFACAWLIGIDGSSQEHRPDRTKIVPEYREIPGIGMAMWFWELEEKCLCSTLVRSWSRRNLLAGNCVMHVSLRGEHRLYLSEKANGFSSQFVFGSSREKVIIVHFPESTSCFT